MFLDKMIPKYKQVKFAPDKSCKIHLGMSAQTQLSTLFLKLDNTSHTQAQNHKTAYATFEILKFREAIAGSINKYMSQAHQLKTYVKDKKG